MKHKKYIRRLASLAISAALFIGCAAGSGEDNAASSPSPSAALTTNSPSPSPDATASPAPTSTPEVKAANLSFEPKFGKVGSDYDPVNVTPKVADYSISPDLSNVENLSQFPNLTEEQKAKLASNGFFATSTNREQLFYIYEENDYRYIPSFVTTDSVLQVYHVFYDYTLRSVEGITLYPTALRLTNNMLIQLQKEYDAITDTSVKTEAMTALGYFGVAQLAFGGALPSDFPEEVKAIVDKEMEYINAANDADRNPLGMEGWRFNSPLFGYDLDYSLFVPRGHYTRSEELKKYFKGMTWYGTIPFPMYKTDGVTRDTQSAIRSIIITAALCRLPEAEGGELWENIYSPTSFFVGAADDFTPYQLAGIIGEVFGEDPALNDLSDTEKLGKFYEGIEKLPKPQINAKNDLAKANGLNVPEGPQFRFMGQRYIPDSEILQELCEPELTPFTGRAFPSGLDVFATLGSKRAAELISIYLKPTEKWPEYTENFERMTAKFKALPDSTWRSNMYYGWLWTQNSLTGEYGEGYPMFMRNTAWQDKSLSTALGSWSEMRHDTILYAKGSAAEKGGGEDPLVVEYVEPNAELYNRLLWLTAYSRENLSARGILPENIKFVCERFEKMLAFLRDCSIKELNGEALTEKEYRTLEYFGGTLESLTTNCVENAEKWHQITSETDRNMAVIADVHTAIPGGYLEEAVGSAAEIYVIVPIEGKLYLTRGAMFDYYEFVSQKRLTDEEWQKMLKNKTAPERPPVSSSFMAGEAMKVPAPNVQYKAG